MDAPPPPPSGSSGSSGSSGRPPAPLRRARPLAGIALSRLQARFGSVRILGVYAFANGLLAIGVLTAAALLTGQPLVFPSLGPTAHLLFSDPMAPAAAPRNAVLGHLIGVAAGAASLAAVGLLASGPTSPMAATAPRVAAAALSLAITSGVMVWSGLGHAPAAATTLIVSLGILHTTAELVVLVVAVVVLVAVGGVVNRLAGVPYPLWAPVRPAPPAVRPGGAGTPDGPGGPLAGGSR